MYLHAQVEKIFEDCRGITEGSNAAYIPELANVDSSLYAMAIVTVDGQVRRRNVYAGN